jgi:hypothetical protein
MPLYVTCLVPSLRVIVPSIDAVTPAPAFGVPVVVSGGHTVAQLESHALVVPPFLSALYR